MKGSRDFRQHISGGPAAATAVVLAIGALVAAACASTGARPKPFPAPGGSAARASPPDRTRGRSVPPDSYAVVGTALGLRGVPYRNGGADVHGFDCSGFTQYVYARHGVALPRAVREQFQLGKKIRPADVVAGDLIFFSTVAPGPSHVGIAVGGDEFVHAPSSTGVVRVEHLSSSYWTRRFVAVRRIM